MNKKFKSKIKDKIDFGDIGIKIGDGIYFSLDPTIFSRVGSGNGTPGNGGTLVQARLDSNYDIICRKYGSILTQPLVEGISALCPLKSITKGILCEQFSEELDIFSFWLFEGKTLRNIYLDRINKLG